MDGITINLETCVTATSLTIQNPTKEENLTTALDRADDHRNLTDVFHVDRFWALRVLPPTTPNGSLPVRKQLRKLLIHPRRPLGLRIPHSAHVPGICVYLDSEVGGGEAASGKSRALPPLVSVRTEHGRASPVWRSSQRDTRVR